MNMCVCVCVCVCFVCLLFLLLLNVFVHHGNRHKNKNPRPSALRDRHPRTERFRELNPEPLAPQAAIMPIDYAIAENAQVKRNISFV